MRRSAAISTCGKYRYQLDRWETTGGGLPTQKIAWIMVNPSTADAMIDDATIRKVRGFSDRMGYQHFVVGNLFAYRATNVRELKTADAPVGILNDVYLNEIMRCADRVMVAWGPAAKLPKSLRNRWEDIMLIAGQADKKLYCLGTAKDGHPLHPLMQPYSAKIVEWTPYAIMGIAPKQQDKEE